MLTVDNQAAISVVSSPALFTTLALGGEMNAIQSLRADETLLITYFCTVFDAAPVTTNEMSTKSAFENWSYPT